MWWNFAITADKKLSGTAVVRLNEMLDVTSWNTSKAKNFQGPWKWWQFTHLFGNEGYQEFRIKKVWSLKIHLHILYCQASEKKRKIIACMCLASCDLCIFMSWRDSNQSSNVPQKYQFKTLSRKTEGQGKKIVTFYDTGKFKVAGRFRTRFSHRINHYFQWCSDSLHQQKSDH